MIVSVVSNFVTKFLIKMDFQSSQISAIYEIGLGFGSFYRLKELRSSIFDCNFIPGPRWVGDVRILQLGIEMKVKHNSKMKSTIKFIGEIGQDGSLRERQDFVDANNNIAVGNPDTQSSVVSISEDLNIAKGSNETEVNKIHLFQVVMSLDSSLIEELKKINIKLKVTLGRPDRVNKLSSKKVLINLKDGVIFSAREHFFIEGLFICACELVACGGLVTVRQMEPEPSGLPTNRTFPLCLPIQMSTSKSRMEKSVNGIKSYLRKSNQGLEGGLHDLMCRQFACCCTNFPPLELKSKSQKDKDKEAQKQQLKLKCDSSSPAARGSRGGGDADNYEPELSQLTSTWNDFTQINEANLAIWEKIKEVLETALATSKCLLLRKYHTELMSRVAKSVISVNRSQGYFFKPTTRLSQLIRQRRKEIGRNVYSLQCKEFDGNKRTFPILMEEIFCSKKIEGDESAQMSAGTGKMKFLRSNNDDENQTTLTSINHYFEKSSRENSKEHLIICVHGLGGSSFDLRLYKLFLKLYLPDENVVFLMSNFRWPDFEDKEVNRATIERAKLLIKELEKFLEDLRGFPPPTKISFIGFSIGGLIIRAALKLPEFDPYISKLNVLVTIGCPHLGVLYMSNRLTALGARVLYRNEPTVKELLLTDKENPFDSDLMTLSKNSRLENFKYIILCGSPEDGVVPHHSANLLLCNKAAGDSSLTGNAYKAMVENLHSNLFREPSSCKLVRYTTWFGYGYPLNPLATAAHVSMIANPSFVEKFMATICKYFK